MRRKSKKFYILFILIVLFGISIGYAAISRTLTITGNSEVRENTWDLHFENIKVTDGSVEAETPTINNDKLSVKFNFMLNLPGDFYEFTVDVKNEGTIDAMIESIEKIPELTEEQKKYMTYIVEYQNGEQIASKQLVSKNNGFVRIKVRVEFRSDVLESDMPTTNQTIDLGFILNYVQADNTATSVKDNGVLNSSVKPVANGSLDAVGTIVTIGDQQFYTIGTEGDNVKLLSMYNLYVGGDYDGTVWTAYGGDATGKQDSTMLGYVSGQSVRKGTTAFSSATQKGTKYSDYNGSIVEGYVNAYKEILEGEEYGIDVVESRLITKDELESEDIGCDSSNDTCSVAPSWIYSTTYWTGSAFDDSYVWYVRSSGNFSFNSLSYISDDERGVRPVIIISKSLF